MRTRHFGYTDTGRRRRHNEDAWLADERLGLFIVCDGVGGQARVGTCVGHRCGTRFGAGNRCCIGPARGERKRRRRFGLDLAWQRPGAGWLR